MSWSGSVSVPNWAGNDNAESGGGGGGGGGSDVGDLYIVPDPTTIEENPSIGLEGRNEIALPTKYRDLEVKNLTAETINGGTIDITRWSLYRAISDVRGMLGAFSIPQYSIADFFDITAANNITAQLGSVVAGINVSAGVQVSAPVGGFNQITAEDINVSFSDETADVNIYGANLLAGDNALYVEGGTTLTGGGIIHGITIGALQVGGIDTVRIDVLPVGMLLTSATTILITAVGATTVTAAGVLALAGGSYIEYNSDEHRFINTTAGNDYTDIYVGNIHAAYGGSQPLRINDVGRGVGLANVKSIDLWTEQPPLWVNSTLYTTGQKVGYLNVYYTCLADNAYTQPNIPIPNWVSASNYITGTIVFSSPYAFRCTSSISGSTTPPNPTSDPNWLNLGLLSNDITQIWQVYSPYGAYILGDDLSTVNVGTVGANAMATDVLGGKTDPYQLNVGASIIADSGVRVINEFNSIQLKGKPSFNATFGFLSSTSDVSTIAQDNSTGQMVITTSDGLTINTNTSTDFSAGDVVNLKNLTLTSALNPTWSDIVPYALNAMVERDGYNWRSEIAGNVGNIPQALLAPWLLSSSYIIGNVRYDVGANNSYLCIANVSGSTTPPSSDPTNWSFFQVGSNAEDCWYQMNPIVESTIVGDRLSGIQIGKQAFVGEAGTYLAILQDTEQVGTIDATIGSGGSITIAGNDSATLGALTGTATILGDSVYILTTPTTGGNILVEANEDLSMGAIGEVALGSTTGNVNITSVAGDIIVNSADALTLAGVNNVALGSTSADVLITSEVSTSITATTGNVNITSSVGNVGITGDGTITISANNNLGVSSVETTTISGTQGLVLSSPEVASLTSTTNEVNITGNTDVNVVATTNNISLTAGNNINLTAGAGDKVIVNSTLDLNSNNLTNVGTINGYNPPLTIYKNATIGSAISRAANTAEIQVYQQTMTLKANTQYMLNMSYAGLTENVSTATPNNNWYIIYRVHQGTTPLTTANLWGLTQLFNNTAQAGGVSASFMTTTSGTYTGRFYIRNQNATVALTVANIQATVIEVV